jgi:hypothetical protein
MITVEYPPGGSDPIHRHNAHAFVYVLEGSIVMQVRGGKEVTLTPGQTFYEGPSDVHVVGRNASQSKPAKFVVFLVKDKGAPVLVPANEIKHYKNWPDMRGRGQHHTMTAKDVHHFRAIGRAAAGCVDYFGGLAEVRGPHNRRGYDGELFHILVSKIIEAVHRGPRDAQRLPGTNLNGRAVNRPGKDALNTVEHRVAMRDNGGICMATRRTRA